MSQSYQSKDLGNGARPPAALGVKYPIWRLGALVSLLYSIGKVIMVAKPDRSLSLKQEASCDRRRKRFHLFASDQGQRLTNDKEGSNWLSRVTGETIPASEHLDDRRQKQPLEKTIKDTSAEIKIVYTPFVSEVF